ncbi:MAG TPA: hypothetical protein VHM30_09640, partial [Gemmatimonadaceae bacterium]|nr:hypothetical protein [Gemmatimonadaceae bacterium]
MKRNLLSTSRAALVGCLIVLAGCRDASVSSPVASTVQSPAGDAARPEALLGIDLGGLPIVGPLLSPDTVVVLQRQAPLPAGVTTTQVVGWGGGVIKLPTAGLTVSIPAGALSAPTPITVTAVPGRSVAYEFSPHGLQFSKPVTLRQDLTETVMASPAALSHVKLDGGYYKSSSDLLSDLLRAVIS